MAMTTDAARFTHRVESSGPAQGMTLTGKSRPVPAEAVGRSVPLVIAVHGGTYTADYFDVPGYSLLDRAEAAGIPVVAIDRPGYAGSTPVALEGDQSIILRNAEVLDHAIAELWTAYGAGTAGIVLIGHSIGGAVVTAIAARHAVADWPLLGIAVSGCLLEVPAERRDAFAGLPEIPSIDLPVDLKDAVMFGPGWSYDDVMPQSSHVANASCPRAELIDINNGWIGRVRSVAAQVTVPVQSRQGRYDHLWITDEKQVSGFGSAFGASPRVDAQLVPTAGHCIDFHRAGAGFQLGQLGFALDCCVQPPAEDQQ
jgi:pimeloyl-ACP methyl ester carboxylesterase